MEKNDVESTQGRERDQVYIPPRELSVISIDEYELHIICSFLERGEGLCGSQPSSSDAFHM